MGQNFSPALAAKSQAWFKDQGAGICTFPGLPCNFLLLVILQSSYIFWILRGRGAEGEGVELESVRANKQTTENIQQSQHSQFLTPQKRIDSGGPDLGTLRARPSALDARALGVPSWGSLQQIQVPGGRFQPWGPRGGTPEPDSPERTGGVRGWVLWHPRGQLFVASFIPGGPRGGTPRARQSRADWGGQGVGPPPSPTVQSGLGGSGGGSPQGGTPRGRPSRAD